MIFSETIITLWKYHTVTTLGVYREKSHANKRELNWIHTENIIKVYMYFAIDIMCFVCLPLHCYMKYHTSSASTLTDQH